MAAEDPLAQFRPVRFIPLAALHPAASCVTSPATLGHPRPQSPPPLQPRHPHPRLGSTPPGCAALLRQPSCPSPQRHPSRHPCRRKLRHVDVEATTRSRQGEEERRPDPPRVRAKSSP
ncbi:hypothetical protein KM043_006407 [Ampulex compressa]|nr:hypothetical protein KM043_006407 [Ampulex compressa]